MKIKKIRINEDRIEYEHCPHCYGSFLFRVPNDDGTCCWCGKYVESNRYNVKTHKRRHSMPNSSCLTVL